MRNCNGSIDMGLTKSSKVLGNQPCWVCDLRYRSYLEYWKKRGSEGGKDGESKEGSMEGEEGAEGRKE